MPKLPCQAAKARRCNSHLDWTSQTLSGWTDESTAAAIMSDPMDVHFNAEGEKNPSFWGGEGKIGAAHQHTLTREYFK